MDGGKRLQMAWFTEDLLHTRPCALDALTQAISFTPCRVQRAWGALRALESREKRCGVGWEEGLACRACAQATTGPKAHGIPSSSSNTGQGRGCRMSPHPCSPPRVTEPPVYGGAPGHPDKGHASQPSLQLPMSRSDRHHSLVVVFRRSCHTLSPQPNSFCLFPLLGM